MKALGRLGHDKTFTQPVVWVTTFFIAAFHFGAIAALSMFSWKALLVAMILWWVAGGVGVGMGYFCSSFLIFAKASSIYGSVGGIGFPSRCWAESSRLFWGWPFLGNLLPNGLRSSLGQAGELCSTHVGVATICHRR
jgi:hypothetical protein